MDRLNLHSVLLSILTNGHVYFQPPESIRLEYPCIVYKRDKLEAKHANDAKYANSTRYLVTAIDKDPDAEWPLTIFDLPKCTHLRQFINEGLNHDVFELYY